MSAETNQLVAGNTDALIIGAGHSGLAMSHCLSELGIDNLILERGEVANSWRTERWDSLRLLTPSWQSRLPGYAYQGDDLDGFMNMPEVIDFIEGYAAQTEAPVHLNTEVSRVSNNGNKYQVETSQGAWNARCVVLASGGFNVPAVPSISSALPGNIEQFDTHQYRNPEQLPEGGCLVVGASATGVQLAEEIHRSGRPVTISVGEHVRVPRTYRGLDIQFWMDACGVLDESIDQVDDLVRARNVPSPQLVGTQNRKTLDLNVLSGMGVELVGRLAMIRDGKAAFSGGLKNIFELADLKMNRLLNLIDEWVDVQDKDPGEGPRERFEPTYAPEKPRLQIDLNKGEFSSVLWATGYRPDYSWLDLPVLDRKGRLNHQGGVVEAPGVYALGLNFLRRRKSSFMHGAEDDARDLAQHLHAYLST